MEKAIAHVVRGDPAFGRVVAAVGPFAPRPPRVDYFNALARAIIYQQLAGRAAAAIHGRLPRLDPNSLFELNNSGRLLLIEPLIPMTEP